MAVMVAISMVMLLVAAALVLDLGLARIDRQVNKSTADAATTAGLRGLDGGDGYPYSYKGVCQALTYIKLNQPALSGLSYPACSNATLLAKKCGPAASADFSQTIGQYNVQIKSPYTLAGSGFPEDSYSTLTPDVGDSLQAGCDQLAVIITQTRQPGLGSLATNANMVTRMRSVGRVVIGRDGDGAVGLLSLEQSDCQVFTTDGTNSSILVKGFDKQPGVIHSDSLGNGANCNSGSKVIDGNHTNGIVAGVAPVGTPADPGVITVRALSTETGAVPANASDPHPEVIAQPNGSPSARGLLTRERVDDRYLGGLRTIVNNAEGLFNSATVVTSFPKTIDCNPTAAQLTAIVPTDSVFVNCPGNPGFNKPNVAINGSRIFFNGKIASPTLLSMPNATEVYVKGFSGAGVNASGGFSMHARGAATCGATPSPASARLIIKDGGLTSNGGVLRLCNTTVILMGGSSSGCLRQDAQPLLPPNEISCGGGRGNGLLNVAGTAQQDWTAPNTTSNTSTPALWNNLEDLALWTETYGENADFSLAGGGGMNLSGVFMAPNANPFKLGGGGTQTIEQSQYISRKLTVAGGATLTLGPNPKDVVTFPVINGFSLVR